MELFDALRARTSVRSYLTRVPGNRVQIDLLNYINNVPVLLPEADISIELLSFEDLLEYFPQEAEKMIKAPLYLAFKGNLDLYQFMNVGYYAEHAAIWLTGRDLASVWQTGFRIRQLQDDEILDEIKLSQSKSKRGKAANLSSSNSESLIESLENMTKPLMPAVLALGYSKQTTRRPASKKRLSKILLSDRSKINNNVLSLLEAARLAPSEYNTQPWRFAVEDENLIHIFMKEPILFNSLQRQYMRQVSMGCALGNMEIMAALRGIRLDYGFMDDIPEYGQSDDKLLYLGTIRIEKVYRQMMFGLDY